MDAASSRRRWKEREARASDGSRSLFACVSILELFLPSRSSSNRGNQEDTIAFFESAGFAAEEADVFLVEVDVQELADLALIVANVAAEIGEAGSKLVEGIGDGGRATVHFRRAVGEAAEGRGNFDGYWHCNSPCPDLCLCTCRCGAELGFQIRLEGFEARGDSFSGREFGSDGVGGFQPVAGDADDSGFVRLDAVLGDEFLRDARSHAACRLGENAFRFGEKLNGVDDFVVGDVLGPAAGLADLLDGKGAVSRTADGERAGDGIGLLWFESGEIALHAMGNRRAARGLRAKKLYWLWLDPAEGDQFAECFGDLGDQRPAGHGNDYVVGERPAELFGDFIAMRFRAFGIVGAQIHVDETPLEAVGDLSAETVDVIVVAVDAHDARAIDRGVEYLGGLEVGGNEDASVEALLCSLRGHGVGEITSRGAAHGGEVETARRRERGGGDAILEGQRRKADGIVLEIKTF